MNYDDIRKYNNDRACVERDGKFGYIDRDTEVVIPLIYDAAKDFSDGVALVCLEGKWGCIDVNGNEVLPLQYDGGVNFVDGYGAMCREGKYAIIEPSVLRFDNTVFPQPARHNLKLCYARPIATNIVD